MVRIDDECGMTPQEMKGHIGESGVRASAQEQERGRAYRGQLASSRASPALGASCREPMG